MSRIVFSLHHLEEGVRERERQMRHEPQRTSFRLSNYAKVVCEKFPSPSKRCTSPRRTLRFSSPRGFCDTGRSVMTYLIALYGNLFRSSRLERSTFYASLTNERERESCNPLRGLKRVLKSQIYASGSLNYFRASFATRYSLETSRV